MQCKDEDVKIKYLRSQLGLNVGGRGKRGGGGRKGGGEFCFLFRKLGVGGGRVSLACCRERRKGGGGEGWKSFTLACCKVFTSSHSCPPPLRLPPPPPPRIPHTMHAWFIMLRNLCAGVSQRHVSCFPDQFENTNSDMCRQQ